jgi:hypothetical protein
MNAAGRMKSAFAPNEVRRKSGAGVKFPGRSRGWRRAAIGGRLIKLKGSAPHCFNALQPTAFELRCLPGVDLTSVRKIGSRNESPVSAGPRTEPVSDSEPTSYLLTEANSELLRTFSANSLGSKGLLK